MYFSEGRELEIYYRICFSDRTDGCIELIELLSFNIISNYLFVKREHWKELKIISYSADEQETHG